MDKSLACEESGAYQALDILFLEFFDAGLLTTTFSDVALSRPIFFDSSAFLRTASEVPLQRWITSARIGLIVPIVPRMRFPLAGRLPDLNTGTMSHGTVMHFSIECGRKGPARIEGRHEGV